MVFSTGMSRRKKKNDSEKKNGNDLLRTWQAERLAQDRELPVPAHGPSEVTLLAYHFRPADRSDEYFAYLECAIRETWRRCGFLHTVIVTNQPTEAMKTFAEPFGIQVEIQVEPTLVPGKPETMSMDCNGRLFKRFATPYVLIVQDDAFPIRPGLGAFLDSGDFWGAPMAGTSWWSRFWSRAFNSHAMDGGFSLRRRALCNQVAQEWRLRYADVPFRRAQHADGVFPTKTLPEKSFSYRHSVTFPLPDHARDFSFDGTGSLKGRVPPFGFRGAHAFKILKDSGKFDL